MPRAELEAEARVAAEAVDESASSNSAAASSLFSWDVVHCRSVSQIVPDAVG